MPIRYALVERNFTCHSVTMPPVRVALVLGRRAASFSNYLILVPVAADNMWESVSTSLG